MTLYHVTTPKKLARYVATGAILPPVRGWIDLDRARQWGREKGRTVVLRIECEIAYPLPDHQPPRWAWWTPNLVRSWEAEPVTAWRDRHLEEDK